MDCCRPATIRCMVISGAFASMVSASRVREAEIIWKEARRKMTMEKTKMTEKFFIFLRISDARV